MKQHWIQKILLVLLVLASRHLVAQGNLVINGTFDVDATGWTISFGDYVFSGGDPGGYIALSSGISNTPTASQAIAGLTPDTVYLISGDYRASKGTSTDNSFGVALDGTFLFETTEPGDFNWHDFSFFYTATSSSAVLSLASQLNGTGISYGIDNIVMYVTPEPSAWSLIFLGSSFLIYFRRGERHCHL
jgi:hypothetical protein